MHDVKPLRYLRPYGLIPTPLRAALFVMVAGLFGALGYSQASADSANLHDRLIAVHYEDRLASEVEPLVTTLQLPPLEIERVEFSSSNCFDKVGSMLVAKSSTAVELELALPPAPQGTITARSCSGTLSMQFWEGERSWPAHATIAVTRVNDLPQLSHDDFSASSVLDSIDVSRLGERFGLTTLVRLSFVNKKPEPITLRGFINTPLFVSLVGPVYLYDPENFNGTYDSLLANSRPLTPISLGPGEVADIAILFDPDQRLPEVAGVITIRPVALIESSGEQFVVPLFHLSTYWNPEMR